VGARLAGLWRGLFDAFVRDNKVLPPVLALLALLLFAWVAAGLFTGGPEDEGVSSGRAELAQSRDPAADGADAPEVEDRDADSYAAYRSKDPFRQLLAPAEESAPAEGTSGSAPDDGTTTPASAPPEDTTGGGGGQGTSLGGAGADSDGDGLTNRDEGRLGQDPRNPDTDGDGIPDGQDDADGDGLPDGQQGGGAGTGVNPGGGGGAGGAGSGGGGSGSDDLFDSGGTLPPR
jgi:hypothetical protein